MLEQPLSAKSPERKLLSCFDDGSGKLILKQIFFFLSILANFCSLAVELKNCQAGIFHTDNEFAFYSPVCFAL